MEVAGCQGSLEVERRFGALISKAYALSREGGYGGILRNRSPLCLYPGKQALTGASCRTPVVGSSVSMLGYPQQE